MRKIEAKCGCGATFSMEDPNGSFITTGGYPDSKGRKFQIERVFDEWLDKHSICQKSVQVPFPIMPPLTPPHQPQWPSPIITCGDTAGTTVNP